MIIFIKAMVGKKRGTRDLADGNLSLLGLKDQLFLFVYWV